LPNPPRRTPAVAGKRAGLTSPINLATLHDHLHATYVGESPLEILIELRFPGMNHHEELDLRKRH